MRINLNLYIDIINDFLNKKTSPKCFEYIYLKLFLEEKGKRTPMEFSILNTLFLDVEAFCHDPALIDEHDIGEDELRQRCKVALEKLHEIKDRTDL